LTYKYLNMEAERIQIIVNKLSDAYIVYTDSMNKALEGVSESELKQITASYKCKTFGNFGKPIDQEPHTIEEVSAKLTMLLNMGIIKQ